MDPDLLNVLRVPRALPPPGTLLVVRGRLDPSPAVAAHLHAVLSPEEESRGASLRIDRVRRRYLATRGWIRWILAGLVERPPGALRFEAGPQGKPALLGLDAAPSFNLAHTGDHLVVVVGREGSVGVDAEEPRALGDLEGVARQVFTPDEVAELQGYREGAARRRAFLRGWTRKEALLKAMGGGLYLPLQGFAVELAEDGAGVASGAGSDPPPQRLRTLSPALREERGGDWHVADVPGAAPEGGAAAVAWDRPPLGVTVEVLAEGDALPRRETRDMGG